MRIDELSSVESLKLSSELSDKNPIPINETKTRAFETSSVSNLHAFAGQMRKSQLWQKFTSLEAANNKSITTNSTNPAKAINGDDEVLKETQRLIENYRRQIKPKEIKGSQPVAEGKPSGHANPKHNVSKEVQAEIMNNPERIFSGKNANGRYVDIYYKNGSAVITEQGNKGRVITAYGLIDKKEPNPKPFKLQKVVDDPNYVEINLEKLGSTNVIYPNKERFEAKDFPPRPPKNNGNAPKTNGGNSTPNETNLGQTGGKTPKTQPAVETPITPKEPSVPMTEELPKVPNVNEPITPKTPIMAEDLPTPPSPIGKLSGNLNRGLVIMQLVQVGLTALNMAKLDEDAKRFGFYIDPFLDKYIITDPDKAAKSLGEGFELKFYTDPNDFYNQGEFVKFTVKDGKFTNPDGWQLVYNKEKGHTEAIILL